MNLHPIQPLPKTFESIQALRAVAALLVTAFHLLMKMDTMTIHSPVLRCFKAGFGGVDLFFIISGFIIMHTNFSKINRPDQLLPYLKKRFGRIYFIYWLIVLLASMVLIGLKTVAPSLQWLSYAFNPVGILKAFTLFPTHESTLPVTWTLSYELYFYLLFGCVIVSRLLLIVPLLIFFATLLTGVMSWLNQPYFFGFRFHDFILSPFNLEFCFGVAAYFLVRRYAFKIPLALTGPAVVLFFLTGELVDPSEIWLRIWGFGVPATVILMALIGREVSCRFPYPDWLLKLGDASYILYLIHMPAIMVVTHALLMLHLPQYVLPANFLLIGALGWSSWELHLRVEKPLLRWINSRRTGPTLFKYRSLERYQLQMHTGKPQDAHNILLTDPS